MDELMDGWMDKVSPPIQFSSPVKICQALLSVPLSSEEKQVATRDRVFPVVAPCLWTALPLEAHLAPTLLSFRNQDKIYLFKGLFLF